MEYDKDEMINLLLKAAELVIKVHDKTNIHEVGNLLCDIEEAIGVIEKA